MTVGELRKKLELYQDDTEIFVHHYEDMTCQEWFADPYVSVDNVRTYTTKHGHTIYQSSYTHQEGSKQHTILVIS